MTSDDTQFEERNHRFEFYKSLFEIHSNRILVYHNDRLRLALYSLTGTAAYFAWIISSKHKHDSIALDLVIYFMPAFFNLLGFFNFYASKRMIERHNNFLNLIEVDILNISPYGGESAWNKFKGDEKKDSTKRSGKAITRSMHAFWFVMIVISIILGCLSVYGEIK